MILSLEWLGEFMNTNGLEAKAFCDRMTDTGSKVEGFELTAEDIINVVAAKIIKIEKHPDSDHLLICQVDVGEEAPRQIVTGAGNVFEGAFVPCAKATANLPGGVVIKPGKLRGVPSDGMLCSMGELGLTVNDMPGCIENGILILDEKDVGEIVPGTDIRDLLHLRDTVVEFEITPNRPDCLSVIGLAREAGVSFERPVTYHTPEVKGCGGNVKDYIDVSVKSELCHRYSARVVKNVKIAPSPLWMRTRLRASGVRPINNIVDITNYVMLEYGQPMHAFDYSCLDGSKIVVRTAAEGEQFISLDDKAHTLKSGMLVIADEKKPVALAGVMGGQNSEITENTATVVFESASFEGSSVRVTSRALGMRTESSGRFEKGLDPENTYAALQRACELVELLGAGEVVDGIVDVYPGKLPQTVIKFEPERINSFLGTNVPEEDMRTILAKLDFTLDGDKIFVPSFRGDVKCVQDIAEEIARIYGYNEIISVPFIAEAKPGSLSPMQLYREKLHAKMVEMGAWQTYTFSFVSPNYASRIGAQDVDSVVIRNPLGEDTSVMRQTLVPAVLDCLLRNHNNHSAPTKLYEISKVYIPTGEDGALPNEPYNLAFGFFGDYGENGEKGFYYAKGMVQALLDCSGIRRAKYLTESENPTYHPGRCAVVTAADGTKLGIFGEVNPQIASDLGFDCRVWAGSFDCEALFAASDSEKHYAPLPKYPSTSRDFAFVCDENLEVGAIEEIMALAGGKQVEDIKLFDVYRGKQVPEGKKSVAFSVTMRASDHTMTDEEADKITKKILTLLENKLGITLRA